MRCETQPILRADLAASLRPEAEVVLGKAVRRAGRPPDVCDSFNRRRLTRAGGHTAEPRRGDEERRSDRGCQPRAYARPGSWTAGKPVDLAAAIAQIRAHRWAPARPASRPENCSRPACALTSTGSSGCRRFRVRAAGSTGLPPHVEGARGQEFAACHDAYASPGFCRCNVSPASGEIDLRVGRA
jgi:hypothetical protein